MTHSLETQWLLRLAFLTALVLAVTACGDESGDDEHGPSTGAICPEGSTLTYESFGKPFMESYCLRCHSSQVGEADRTGAPLDHNFDTLEDVLDHADHIDQWAASGPAGTNTSMPPSDPKPVLEERKMLGEWLQCELAK